MLSLLRKQAALQISLSTRSFAEAAAASNLASTSASPPPISNPSESTSEKAEYFVPRNTRGNLPVYTDVRNAGSRYLVLIRNVEGDVGALVRDLTSSLFKQDSEERARMKVHLNQSKHVVIQGGRWKNDVAEWLKQKGF